MQVSERVLNGVTVLDVSGRLTMNDNPGRLKAKVSSLVLKGELQIVLNLGALSYIDSAGLGELVSCYTRTSKVGAMVKLANPSTRVYETLVLTRLVTIFDVYESEAAAVGSFGVLAVA